MIEMNETATTAPGATEPRKVLRWREDDRMGGRIPVWESRPAAKAAIEQNLSAAAAGKSDDNFDSALAYAGRESGGAPAQPEEFTFGDVIDIINPLHHLPLIGFLYRELTGDEIRPSSKILGGAAFGGFAGAATSLADTIIEHETGRDMAGNVLALVNEDGYGDRQPSFGSTAPPNANKPPQQALEQALENLETAEHSRLPGTVTGFTDLGYGKREVYERTSVADGRTAGTMVQRAAAVSAPHPAREPITQVTMDPMPLLNRPSDLLYVQEEALD